MKKWIICFLLAISLLLSSMCSFSKDNGKIKKEILYEIVKKEKIPEKLKLQIDNKKDQEFCISYQDQEFLYLAKGYERQKTDGYSVKVTDCFETSGFLYFCTDLIGPPDKEAIKKESSHPYVVIRIKRTDKNIIFK